VAFVSTTTDAPLVDSWVEKLSSDQGSRVVVCYVSKTNERSRIHTAEPDDLVNAAIQGVRQRFAHGLLPPFEVFLSYRRADGAIAAAVH
jgi:hypothetical protein